MYTEALRHTDHTVERQEVPGMDLLKGESAVIDWHQEVYAAESIGIDPNSLTRHRVIAEVGIPVITPTGDTQIGLAAVVEAFDEVKGFRWQILGLQKNTQNGEMRIIDSGKQAVEIKDEAMAIIGGNINPVIINSQDDSTDPMCRQVVLAEAIWGKGYRFADRKQSLTVKSHGNDLVLSDQSRDGTWVKASNVRVQTRDNINIQVDAMVLGRLVRQGAPVDEKHMTYNGYKIITRDTALGGPNTEGLVRVLSPTYEAIVVAPTQDPSVARAYHDLYSRFERYLSVYQKDGKQPREAEVLAAVYAAVSDTIHYDLPFVNRLTTQIMRAAPEAPMVNLAEYLRAGRGVCRHMSLAVSWLGGEAAANGLLAGRFTVDANGRQKDNSSHEWGQYTDLDGHIWILDVAQSYLAPLEESLLSGRRWDYFAHVPRNRYMLRFGDQAMPSHNHQLSKQLAEIKELSRRDRRRRLAAYVAKFPLTMRQS